MTITDILVCSLQAGKGLIKVNGRPLSLVEPQILRFKVRHSRRFSLLGYLHVWDGVGRKRLGHGKGLKKRFDAVAYVQTRNRMDGSREKET